MQGKSVHNGVIFAFLILFMPVDKIGLNMRKRSYLVKSLVRLIMIDRMNTDREIHPLEGYEFINLIGNIPVQCRFFFLFLCLRCIWAIRYKRLSIIRVRRLHFNIQNKRKHDRTTLMLAITFIPTNSQNNGRFREINHFASIGRSVGRSVVVRILLWIWIPQIGLQTNSMEFRLMKNSMAMIHSIENLIETKKKWKRTEKAKMYSVDSLRWPAIVVDHNTNHTKKTAWNQ